MKQTGGSVASDAVTTLVTPDTYAKLNSTFTNSYSNGDGQCGGGLNKCPTCGGAYKKTKKVMHKHKKPVKKTGGNAVPDFLQKVVANASAALAPKANFVNSGVFHSQPAPALNSVLPRNVGVQHHSNSKSQFTNSSMNTPKMMNAPKMEFTNSAMNAPKMMNTPKMMNAPKMEFTNSAMNTPKMMNASKMMNAMKSEFAAIDPLKPAVVKVGGKKKVPLPKKKSPSQKKCPK